MTATVGSIWALFVGLFVAILLSRAFTALDIRDLQKHIDKRFDELEAGSQKGTGK